MAKNNSRKMRRLAGSTSTVKCNAGDFDQALAAIVTEFADACDEEIDKAIRKAAKASLDSLHSAKPPNSAHGYPEGWKAEYKNKHFGEHSAIIHHATKPGLPHLLEFGHELYINGKYTGRRAPAYPHVAPAADAGADAMKEALGI